MVLGRYLPLITRTARDIVLTTAVLLELQAGTAFLNAAAAEGLRTSSVAMRC